MSVMLHNYPEEQRTIGQILTFYGDLEYQLSGLLGSAINNRHAAIRALFRLRGGNLRVQAADAICRPAYTNMGLKDEYETTLGATRYSTKIRNQYAHCHFWDGKEAGLFFTDLEKAATTAEGDLSYGMRHIDQPLLELQCGYLEYATHWLMYLSREYDFRAGKRPSPDAKAPKIIDKPPLHNPVEEHPLPGSMRARQRPPEAPPPEDHRV